MTTVQLNPVDAQLAQRLCVMVDNEDGINLVTALAPEGMTLEQAKEELSEVADQQDGDVDGVTEVLTMKGYVIFTNFLTISL